VEVIMRILITGGTSGIGNGVARQAAQRGWKVTITGRRSTEGMRIAAAIGASFIEADVSRMADIRRLADRIDEPLDALVMCAGGLSMKKEIVLTSEGLETTFATNYLGKFALSQLLLERNLIAPDGCIVMVGGNGVHKRASTAWDTPHTGTQAAFKAALAVDLYAAEFARRYPHLRVHTCYPGVVRTNLFREAPLPFRLIARLLGKPAAQGSAYLSRLLLERHAEVHWKLDRPMRFSPPLPAGGTAEQLWRYSEQAVLALTS
jgi:NAD(P)-dependent dehydrogenase (short-subunit alcohol dehydrogenase family)